MSVTTARTSNEIADWIIAWVADESKLERSAVETDQPFVNFGLSSRQAVVMSGELENWLGREIAASAVWDYPTIQKLADHLASA